MPEVENETLDPAKTDLPGENSRNGAKKRRDPNEPAAVIGIGASAGGIAPLQQFFSDMKVDTGLAFVVVMHLSPEHESQLASVIQQKTTMPVTQVTEPVKVHPNHVYVIPPTHQLTFEDSMLRLVPPQNALGRRVTIDLFFRTLAQAYGQRAVCVILSGTDSDGVIGLKHIRAQGGLTIVQDPNEAEYDSMPATAVSTGMVDWVLPVAEMPDKLLEFVENENRMKLPPEIPDGEPDEKVDDAPGGETVSDETRSTEDEEAIGKVLADVRAQTGHDFSHYKRATVLRRIARRLQVNSLESIPRYVDFLRTHPAEARALLQDLLIGVTHFFRDHEAFAVLESHIPQLFAGKKKDEEVRVWVAGCASGEEAYSIAMLLCEHAAKLDNPPGIQIFASDIDEEAIADARDAIYPSMIEVDVSPERLRAFFVRDHGRYRVRKEIREKVLFAHHNLLSDAPFSRCDLISCRNLLIYLNATAQGRVFDVFHFSLRSGAMLFLGGAENHSQAQSLFSPVDAKHRLFVRRSTPRPTWKLPTIPMPAVQVRARRPAGWRSRPLPPLTHALADDAAQSGTVAAQAGHARREVLFGELHLRLLEQYGPPSVVVNDAHDIVHLSDNAGRYLQFVAGEPTANIGRVIIPQLQLELRTTLFKATQQKQSVMSRPVGVQADSGTNEIITLEIRPMEAKDEAAGFYLILFHKQAETAETAAPTPAQALAGVSHEADDEIQFLKEQLANTVEQYEAANEELKASNEELQAMNEEMRSATEELETSKEELQSVNEELTTVNHELKANVEELSNTNADLNNLMASTDVGTIFLDRQLRIHRFTPAAQKIFNLIPSDMGRPLSDITSALKYDGFIHDAEVVLRDLQTVEREVRVGENNQWYLTRIAPYRTSEDRIAGVVATFIDITRRKQAEDELRASREELERQTRVFDATLSTITDFAYLFDRTGRFVFANKPLLDLWGLKLEEAVGKNFFDLKYEPELAAKLQSQIEQVFETGEVVRDETAYINPEGKEGYYEYTFSPLRGADGEVQAVVGSTHIITDRKQAELALRESEERFRTVADNVPQVIWTNDAQGTANYFNRRWYEYSGLSYEESAGRGWEVIVHADDAPASVEQWKQALKNGEVFDAEYRLRNADGDYRWFIGRNVPLRQNGEVLGWFGTATDIDDLKQAQARTREIDERFHLLVEGTPDYAMFLLDPGNVITFWSSGAQKVFGWTAEEAVGQGGDIIFIAEDKAKGAVEEELGIAIERGRAPDRRWHKRKDGSRLWADGIMRRINRKDGSLRGFAKICRDATDQRAIEDALRHSKDEMEQRVLERTRDLLVTNKELERTMSQRQQLEKELLEISEREKRRIGEDLHDMVCQELTATALFLKSSAKQVAEESPAAAKTLDESAQIVNRNVGVTRDLARGLQPAELKGSGLRQALRALSDQACEANKVKCHFKASRNVRVTDDTIALTIYRIAQEAVTNALKHAEAKNILITLDRNEEHVCVTVEDDGKGFPRSRKGKGLGLHIMRYRANALGGELVIEKRKRGGTEVRCKLPVKR
ncbi:MAG: PAS domain S-box protein [Chthoniobacterales bacterium]